MSSALLWKKKYLEL